MTGERIGDLAALLGQIEGQLPLHAVQRHRGTRRQQGRLGGGVTHRAGEGYRFVDCGFEVVEVVDHDFGDGVGGEESGAQAGRQVGQRQRGGGLSRGIGVGVFGGHQ